MDANIFSLTVIIFCVNGPLRPVSNILHRQRLNKTDCISGLLYWISPLTTVINNKMIAGGGLQTFTTWFSWNLIHKEGCHIYTQLNPNLKRGCKPLELSGSRQICWIENAVCVCFCMWNKPDRLFRQRLIMHSINLLIKAYILKDHVDK